MNEVKLFHRSIDSGISSWKLRTAVEGYVTGLDGCQSGERTMPHQFPVVAVGVDYFAVCHEYICSDENGNTSVFLCNVTEGQPPEREVSNRRSSIGGFKIFETFIFPTNRRVSFEVKWNTEDGFSGEQKVSGVFNP